MKHCLILLTLLLHTALLAATPAETRAAFQKIIDRPKVDPAVEIKKTETKDGLTREHFTFASDAKNRVPVVIFKSEEGAAKRPVVLCLHGTGSNKESNFGHASQLAKRGFIGVALDARYHGERCPEGKGDVAYNDAIFAAYKDGGAHPFYWDTVWDVQRLIDVLQARPDVDGSRIGIMGFSKGGIETYFTAASDERITAAAPLIGMQSFKWGLDNNSWQKRIGTIKKAADAAAKHDGTTIDLAFAKKFLAKLVPGMYSDFDGPVMVTLIAPRPLLIINGDEDANTPLTGLRECEAAAKKAYAAAGAEDKFRLIVQEKTGHTVNKPEIEEVYNFFVKHLKP